MKIDSLQNKRIKYLQRLQKKSKLRQSEERIVIEGVKEIEIALKNNYQFEEFYLCPTIYNNQLKLNDQDCIEVTKAVYDKIAYRNSTEGIIGLAKPKSHHLSSLELNTKNPLILIAEAPEKPGNIGALLRTADAAKLDAVIIANPRTDLYNPNTIRASLGTLFSNTIGVGTTEDIIKFLNQGSINIYTATLQNSNPYTQVNYTKPSAIVVGTEANGLSEAWRKAAKQSIYIPMQGHIDSLNVSVSAGVLIFEAKRQRDSQ